MHLQQALLALATAGTVVAQRPADMPICDYYTTALLKNNTAENQYTLLTLLVNTVVIGNYTQPNVGVKVPGILAPGDYMGTKVNLAPYFNGMLASSNRGGSMGVSVNFLDGGGAAPLMMNKPANDTSSNQYFLLTHLYSFFGVLLGCSKVGPNGTSPFPAYTGKASMYDVHKFMALGPADMGYFITQVGMAGASFGVAQADLTAVAMALNTTFDMKCSPPAEVIKGMGPQLQAICIEDTCPLAQGAVCGSYAAVVEPMNATMTMSSMTGTMTSTGTMTGTGTMSMTGTGTAATTSATKTAGAAVKSISLLAVAAGVAALML